METSKKVDPSALFVSAEGGKIDDNRYDTTISNYILKVLSSKSSFDHPILRMYLQYNYIEATTHTNMITEKVIFDDYDSLALFEKKGELYFLKVINERQYELLKSRISTMKNQLSLTPDRMRVNSLKKIIEDDERLLIEFDKWFTFNDLEIPKQENETYTNRTNTRTAGSETITIDSMHSLRFIKLKCDNYSDQVTFKLYNNEIETPEIGISQMDGSLLLFLAEERKNDGVNWLLKPNDYKSYLIRIFNDLQLKSAKEHSDVKWFKMETKNSRYKIVSRINKKIQETGFLNGNLLVNRQVDNYIKGIYTLTPSIINIIL